MEVPKDFIQALVSFYLSSLDDLIHPNGFRCHLSADISKTHIFGPHLSSELQISAANGQCVAPGTSCLTGRSDTSMSTMDLLHWQNCSSSQCPHIRKWHNHPLSGSSLGAICNFFFPYVISNKSPSLIDSTF